MSVHRCVDCAAGPDAASLRPRPATYGGPRTPRCRTHQRARERAARARAREAYVARGFGLSREEYAALVAHQGGRCAWCRRAPATRALPVDHDHRAACGCTGRTSCGECVRGLLCGWCNEALGRLEQTGDAAGALVRAVAYLADPPMAQVRRKGRT